MTQQFEPYTTDERASWSEQAKDVGRRVRDESVEAASAARGAVQDHPVATLAAIGGLAFAVGALWMIARSRQSRPSLLNRLGDLQSELPRRWRA